MRPTSGFRCPICVAPTRVIRTETVGRQILKRRRKCPECGHRFSTQERPLPAPAEKKSQ